MKKSRFSERQIAFVLRQADEGIAVAEECRKRGLRWTPIVRQPEPLVKV